MIDNTRLAERSSDTDFLVTQVKRLEDELAKKQEATPMKMWRRIQSLVET